MNLFNNADLDRFYLNVSSYKIKNFNEVVLNKNRDIPVFCEDSSGRFLISLEQIGGKSDVYLSPKFPVDNPTRDDQISPVFEININPSQSIPLRMIIPAVVRKSGQEWVLESMGKISIKR